MAYTAASRRGWQRGALLGAVGFAGSAAIVQALELPLPALLGLSAVLLSLARLAMPRRRGLRENPGAAMGNSCARHPRHRDRRRGDLLPFGS